MAQPLSITRFIHRLHRLRLIVCAATIALLMAPIPVDVAAAGDERTWIIGATVISPERADNGQKLNVLVEGDHIAAIVKATARPPESATIYDATGMYLIPGLIDGHVHIASVPGFTQAMTYTTPSLTNLTRDYR